MSKSARMLSMAYAINIRSDQASTSNIQSLCAAYRGLEGTSILSRTSYPPHITLASYDDIDPAVLADAIDSVATDFHQIEVEYRELGQFQTPTGFVLWAKPTLSNDISRLHSRVHQHLGPERSRTTYQPGVWVPRPTLATAIGSSQERELLRVVEEGIKPIRLILDVIDCASFPPAAVLHERKAIG